MMKRTCILLIFIAASMAAYSQKISGTDTEAIDRAYLEQDISTLISFHTSAPDLKKKIEDFLLNSWRSICNILKSARRWLIYIYTIPYNKIWIHYLIWNFHILNVNQDSLLWKK